MKKLKECGRYNVLILAVLVALAIKLVHYIYAATVTTYQMITWDMLDVYGYATIGTLALSVLFIVLAMSFVVQAVRKDPKLMICAIAALAVVAVAGVSYCAVQCIIACGCWLWMVKKAPDKPQLELIRRATLLLILVAAVIFVIGELSWRIPYGFGTLREELLLALERLTYNCFNPEVLLVAYLYKQSENKMFRNICRIAAVIWLAVTLYMFATTYSSDFFGFSHWGEWPSDASLEEGSWEGWTTIDEDGNFVYYDEEGNGEVVQSFEFE